MNCPRRGQRLESDSAVSLGLSVGYPLQLPRKPLKSTHCFLYTNGALIGVAVSCPHQHDDASEFFFRDCNIGLELFQLLRRSRVAFW
jgi:hypothetical protein